jgi:hypothetical protein
MGHDKTRVFSVFPEKGGICPIGCPALQVQRVKGTGGGEIRYCLAYLVRLYMAKGYLFSWACCPQCLQDEEDANQHKG